LPAKLTTTIKNIEIKVENETNRHLISEFYAYLTSIDTSENYQNGLIKVLIRFAEHLGGNTTFFEVQDKEKILQFLDLRKKQDIEDPDKKWITTWNDYLWRIKYFYRWLYNAKDKGVNAKSYDTWITPSFIDIKMKITKRLSPYLETEIWERDDLFTVIKYESSKRNKAALSKVFKWQYQPNTLNVGAF